MFRETEKRLWKQQRSFIKMPRQTYVEWLVTFTIMFSLQWKVQCELLEKEVKGFYITWMLNGTVWRKKESTYCLLMKKSYSWSCTNYDATFKTWPAAYIVLLSVNQILLAQSLSGWFLACNFLILQGNKLISHIFVADKCDAVTFVFWAVLSVWLS